MFDARRLSSEREFACGKPNLCQIFPMRRIIHLVVLVAFVCSCGGHWAAFQVIAWANMIREYSAMVPTAQAVEMTFSGKYPCPICKAIAEKRSSEQQKALAFDKYGKKFISSAAITITMRTSVAVNEYPDFHAFLDSRTEPPLLPPPRRA
jgi:hypothetical protein